MVRQFLGANTARVIRWHEHLLIEEEFSPIQKMLCDEQQQQLSRAESWTE